MNRELILNKEEKNIAKEEIVLLWENNFEKVKEEVSLELEIDKKRFKELSSEYASATIKFYEAKFSDSEDLYEAESIRENYDIALDAFLKKIAKKNAKKFLYTFSKLMEKSGHIVFGIIWKLAKKKLGV